MSNKFSFGEINTNVQKKYQSKKVSSILVHSKNNETNDNHILFLLESPISSQYLYSLKIWIESNLKDYNYDIVLASLVNIPTEAIKKNGVYMFYKNNQSSWKNYVQKNKTIVVTIGYSLYAITLSSDLNIASFYDFIFNKTYFYAPRSGTYVFPIDGIDKLLKQDNTGIVPNKSSYVKFAELQLSTIKNRYNDLKVPPTPVRPKIIKLGTKEEVDAFYEQYKHPQKVAWDIETSSLNFNRGRPGCITFSFDGRTGYYINWNLIEVDKLSRFFENKYQIGQNCLEGNTKVLMADGSRKKISTLVKERNPGPVMSFSDNGVLEPKLITNWWKNGKLDKEDSWLDIRFDYKNNRNGYTKILCTKDHEIYTKKGKIKAKNLKVGDKIVTEYGINDDLYQFLLGSFLGDGCFKQTGKYGYISFSHAPKQKEYLEWKHQYLKDNGLRVSPIKIEKNREMYTFRLKSSPVLDEFFTLTKEEAISKLDVKGLVIWFFDDGTAKFHNSKKGFSLEISASGLKEHEIILAKDKINNILCGDYVQIKKKIGGFVVDSGFNHKLVFNTESSKILASTLQSSTNTKMPLYKLNNIISNDYSWDTSKREGEVDIISISNIKPKGTSIGTYRYDLEVEDNHNYIANGIKVSNCKFDIKFLKKFGVKNIKADSDTMHLSHTINEMRLHGLKSLAYYYTQYGGYDYDLDEYISKFKPKTYLDIPEPLLMRYATMDAIVNYYVNEKMQKQLDEIDYKFPPPKEGWWTLRKYYEEIKIPLANKFIDIELRGFPVDMEKWNLGSAFISDKIMELKTRLFDSLKVKEALSKSNYSLSSLYTDMDSIFDSFDEGEDTSDLNSSKKLGEVLEFLGWEDLGRTKAGSYLTGDEQLQRWEQLGHEEAKYIVELRSYSTLMKTFLGNVGTQEGWRAYIDEHNGGSYIHPSYRSMMTESGRISCGDPNFQQVPSKSLGADLFKKIISVPNINNQYLVTLDYSSLQMRLATIDSEDPVLYNAYLKNPNIDMHSKTGYNIFCKGKEFDIEEYIIEGKTYLSTQTVKVKNTKTGTITDMPVSDIYSNKENTDLLLV